MRTESISKKNFLSFPITVNVGELIDIDLNVSPSTVCIGEPVTIIDATGDARIDSYHFSTDENRGSEACPDDSIQQWSYFHEAGTHDITFYADYNGCITEEVFNDAVTVNGPSTKFNWTGLCNDPTNITFTATPSEVDSIYWIFDDEILAKNVVLAMGASEQPFWPKWAKNGGDRVHHIFDPKFLGLPTKRESIAVVGGGISAGQVALRLQKQGNEVHLVSRHEIREHQFDSEPGWLGPRYMNGFSKEKDLNNRRKMITHARHRGSLPPAVNNSLQQAIISDQITRHECGISDLKLVTDGICLEMNDGSTLQVEHILLATGFATNRPGGKFVDQLIETASLPCSECGYPIVDETLCWHPGIYVSGPLAELELGPSSRNISGARRAAKRIVKVARSDALIF